MDRIVEGIDVQITQLPQWHRQNLVALERVHQDITRFTGPVVHIFTIAAAIYLPCYAKLILFAAPSTSDPMMVLLALSAIALVLVSPAFALAATVEVYFTRRIARASRAGAQKLPDATLG